MTRRLSSRHGFVGGESVATVASAAAPRSSLAAETPSSSPSSSSSSSATSSFFGDNERDTASSSPLSSSSFLRWHDFLLHDAAHPHELDAQIRSSASGPMRFLLARSPPPFVVREVLDRHRDAIFSPHARAANRRGETPLHQACSFQSTCSDVVVMIYEEDPDACRRRSSPDCETPLHVLRDDAASMAALLRGGRNRVDRGSSSSSSSSAGAVVTARDRHGCFPLHASALRDETAGPTRVLVEAGRDARRAFGPGGGSLEENFYGKTPLGMACWYFISTAGSMEATTTTTTTTTTDASVDGRWEKLEVLAEAALEALEADDNDHDDCASEIPTWKGRAKVDDDEEQQQQKQQQQQQQKEEEDDDDDDDDDEMTFRIVHAVIELGCPEPIVLRAIRMHPEQLSQRDARGFLPIHLACGGGRRRRKQNSASNSTIRSSSDGSRRRVPDRTASTSTTTAATTTTETKKGCVGAVLGAGYQKRMRAERQHRCCYGNSGDDLLAAVLPAVAPTSVFRALLDPPMRERTKSAVATIGGSEGHPVAAAASASASVPDGRGRLPLHILAERAGLFLAGGKKGGRGGRGTCGGIGAPDRVSMSKAFLHDDDNKDPASLGTLALVFRAAPRALETRDMATGMLPFMLAAAVGSVEGEKEDGDDGVDDDGDDDDYVKDEDENDLGRLDVVYCLLRKEPSVLRQFVQPNV